MSALSPRQTEVLTLVARGYRHDEIAEVLGTPRDNVKYLLRHARESLGARTTAHAVAVAVALGLVEIDTGQGARIRAAREHLATALRHLSAA